MPKKPNEKAKPEIKSKPVDVKKIKASIKAILMASMKGKA